MVPRFSIRSSLDMPMPLSWIVSVFASLSVVIEMAISGASATSLPAMSAACQREREPTCRWHAQHARARGADGASAVLFAQPMSWGALYFARGWRRFLLQAATLREVPKAKLPKVAVALRHRGPVPMLRLWLLPRRHSPKDAWSLRLLQSLRLWIRWS